MDPQIHQDGPWKLKEEKILTEEERAWRQYMAAQEKTDEAESSLRSAQAIHEEAVNFERRMFEIFQEAKRAQDEATAALQRKLDNLPPTIEVQTRSNEGYVEVQE